VSVAHRLRSAVAGRPALARALDGSVSAVAVVAAVPRFLRAWLEYRELAHAEPLRLRDADPRLSDRLPTSPYDPHYLHQAVWAAERIVHENPHEHVDVGSSLTFVTMLATSLPVTFVDIRPLELTVAQLRPIVGDVLAMPFADRSLASLSSLHVIEHVGLGRYGDDLNPLGTRQALAELERVLAPGGNLFLSTPIGRPRVCFNAHRIHDPRQIVSWMADLELVEFSAVDDDGLLHLCVEPREMAALRYGCGLFWFRRHEAIALAPARASRT
jgi:SAM-dependent methyltransferase